MIDNDLLNLRQQQKKSKRINEKLKNRKWCE